MDFNQINISISPMYALPDKQLSDNFQNTLNVFEKYIHIHDSEWLMDITWRNSYKGKG